MKKLILKLLGFDKLSIQTLKKEIIDLNTTLSNLKQEMTDIYEKTEKAFIIINLLKIDKENELWWENNDLIHTDYNIRAFAERIKDIARRDWIKKHPALKVHKVFHGGCLGCNTPLKDGIGRCLDCYYLNGNNSKDLSNYEINR